MATHNKKTAKVSKGAKAKPVVKKAAPAAKPVAIKKKTVSKPVEKKAVKPAPAKKAAAKKAPVPAKKAISSKPAKNNSQKTVNKKNSKAAAPAATKKAAPVKKAAPAAPVKKAAVKPAAKPVAKPAAKKAAVKPVAKPATKPAPKAPAKPEPKAAAKAAPKAPAKPEPKVAAKPEPKAPVAKPKAKSSSQKKLTLTQMPVKASQQLPKPTATPAARPVEKKPNVIIAHRRMENKSKKEPVTTSAQYQPETYRSILDEPVVVPQGPVYRYSDEELLEFKEIITSRLDAARKELNYLQGLITRKDEAGTEDTENRYMNMEDGSGAMEREQLAQLASRQIQFMGHLEKALVRIENKTYGICRVTGKLIDKARLRAVPHATLSIEAKKMMGGKQN